MTPQRLRYMRDLQKDIMAAQIYERRGRSKVANEIMEGMVDMMVRLLDEADKKEAGI